jgi:hypothetical protein
MLLLVVEDRHAERELRRAFDAARARSVVPVVLTTDALLAMRLRREGIDARLPADGLTREKVIERDAIAIDALPSAFEVDGHDVASALGTSYGPYLHYTLLPAFVRAVRNITAVDDVLSGAEAGGTRDPSGPSRIMLVGGGALVDAARLVADRRQLSIELVGRDFATRAAHAFARLRAGAATRWVNTDFRSIVLEPGFIWLLFWKGLWQRLTGQPCVPRRGVLIVVGDRFTADVVERVRGEPRSIVLAGATQPGRALFDTTAGLTPIDRYSDWLDPLRWVGWTIEAMVSALRLTTDGRHRRRFVVCGVPCWPLVGRGVWLHVIAWVPVLRQVQALAARVANACPDAQLLTSTDVTAYNRVLIDTVRRFGVRSTGIQHGITGQPNGHSVVHVDRFATWGEASEAWYRRHATQRAEFVVTGNPRFDVLAARLAPQPPAPSPQPPFTVAVCTGFVSDFSVLATEYENLLMLDAVLEWARRHPGTAVIHKMHPGEELDYYARAARALQWDPLTLKTIHEPILYDVLERSHVMVASYSSTVLESIALGTPAIVVDAIARYRLLPLDEIRGVTIALSVDELHAQLTARLEAYPAKETARRDDPALVGYIGQLDGGAADRIAKMTVL